MAGLSLRATAVCFGWGAAAALAALPWRTAHAAPGWDGVHDRDLSGWELHLSPYTVHFSKEPHTDVYLAALAKVDERGWMAGGAAFRNSFGQPCAYVFAGRKYAQPWGWDRVYWSWTAGIVYGYKPPYDDKVIAHAGSFSPGFTPTVGYQLMQNVSAELALIGTAGLMFNIVLLK